MYYVIEEANDNRIIINDNSIHILIDDITLLKDPNKMIGYMVRNSKYLSALHVPNEIFPIIEDVIINDMDSETVVELLIENRFPLFSLVLGYVDNAKRKYKILKELTKGIIVINCNRENFIKCLDFASELKKQDIIIEAKNISLSEYKDLLENYHVNKCEDANITVNYQDNTSGISIKELYNLSLLVDNIAKDVKEYNLSPLEQIIYVYDFVKQREYSDCDDKHKSRDLDKVVNGEHIVCVGYSNLFNAILLSLGINAMPLISIKVKHQRSLIYVQDKKYNIDGIYAFDPTWDRKREDEYINNYKYFAMPFNDSERDAPSELFEKTNLTLEELKEITSYDYKTEYIACDKMLYLEKMFNFTNTKDFKEINDILSLYEFTNVSEKEKLKVIYNQFRKKYLAKEIPVEGLFEAILNVRIIEYYKNIVQSIDVEDITDAVCTRYSYRYGVKDDKFSNFIKRIFIYSEVEDKLASYEEDNKEEIDRKKGNVRLLKTLRKVIDNN